MTTISCAIGGPQILDVPPEGRIYSPNPLSMRYDSPGTSVSARNAQKTASSASIHASIAGMHSPCRRAGWKRASSYTSSWQNNSASHSFGRGNRVSRARLEAVATLSDGSEHSNHQGPIKSFRNGADSRPTAASTAAIVATASCWSIGNLLRTRSGSSIWLRTRKEPRLTEMVIIL